MQPEPDPVLTTYWIYHLDQDEQFLKGEVFVALDDTHALLQVRSVARGHVIEIWTRNRLVSRLGPKINLK